MDLVLRGADIALDPAIGMGSSTLAVSLASEEATQRSAAFVKKKK